MLSSICCWHVSMVVPVSDLISIGNLNQCNGFLKKVTTCTTGITFWQLINSKWFILFLMIFDDFENATLFLTVFTEVGQDYYYGTIMQNRRS